MGAREPRRSPASCGTGRTEIAQLSPSAVTVGADGAGAARSPRTLARPKARARAALAQRVGLAFRRSDGRALAPQGCLAEWRRILTAAKLPTIRPHDLRHTAGTLMREHEVDIKVIQETLGHSSISTSLDIYGHVTPGLRKQAVNAQ